MDDGVGDSVGVVVLLGEEADPLVDLDDLVVENAEGGDGEVEDVGAGLSADGEEVAETFCNEEDVRGAGSRK